MTDLTYIQNLLTILKTHQVKHIKMQGIELTFDDVKVKMFHVEQPSDNSTEVIAEALKEQEKAMPPDLRADALMDQDKVLNWSSPDQKPFDEEPELPLTGEQPL